MDTASILHLSSNGGIGVVLTALILFSFGHKFAMLFGSAFFLGIIFSAYYPYMFALPKSFNRTISSKNSSTIMIFYAIGEGLLVSVVGILMEKIDPLMLFICCLVMMVFNKILLVVVIAKFNLTL